MKFKSEFELVVARSNLTPQSKSKICILRTERKFKGKYKFMSLFYSRILASNFTTVKIALARENFRSKGTNARI